MVVLDVVVPKMRDALAPDFGPSRAPHDPLGNRLLEPMVVTAMMC